METPWPDRAEKKLKNKIWVGRVEVLLNTIYPPSPASFHPPKMLQFAKTLTFFAVAGLEWTATTGDRRVISLDLVIFCGLPVVALGLLDRFYCI